MSSLYSFQQEAVAFHLKHHYTLNCSEMGLGKTRMALETARAAGLRTLVFGPAFLESTWDKEGLEVGKEFAYIPYSMAHKLKAKDFAEYRFIIADECHYLKNPKALRTHAFYSFLKELKPDYFIGLTGTPIKNRVPDFWTLLAFCGANPQDTNGSKLTGDLTHYYKFSRHFCHIESMIIRGRRVEKFKGIKEDKIPELKALLKDKYLRFTVDKVLKELPPMTRKYIEYDLENDDTLGDAFSEYMEGGKANIVAKTASATLKTNKTIEYVKNLQEEDCGPLVIFTDHIEPTKKISAALKGAAVITGQTPMPERAMVVSKFQAGEIHTIVATIGSLSVGVTLHAARNVIFNDLSWSPSENAQAEKRIHRIGQERPCVAHYIEATPTDTYIRKTLMEKLDTINKIVV